VGVLSELGIGDGGQSTEQYTNVAARGRRLPVEGRSPYRSSAFQPSAVIAKSDCPSVSVSRGLAA
jgi:hypothetical protein